MTEISERVALLLAHRRFADAEREIMQWLSVSPDDSDAKYLLSVCRLQQNDPKEAERLIREAIHTEPGNDRYFFQLAQVYIHQDLYSAAEKTLREAISLFPEDPDYWGLLASIRLIQKEYEDALALANHGLALDPDHILSLNVRSGALLKMKRTDDAFRSLENTLSKDPQNSMTYASYGWAELEKGNHKQAMGYFRESLKLNPHDEYARSGMVQALKARYWLYRIYLSYAFWISNFKSQYQWGILIGFMVVSRFLGPFRYAYIAFALFTWLAAPLSNLLLRLNAYGRYLLTEEEIKSSNLVGVSLTVSLAMFGAWFVTPQPFLLLGGILFAALMIPLSTVFAAGYPRGRRTLQLYAAAMTLVAIGATVWSAMDGRMDNLLVAVFAIGFFAHGFLANYLIIRMK